MGKIMRKVTTGLAIVAVATSAHAFDTSDASKKVQQYSELIACQLPDPSDYPPNQYKAVQIKEGMEPGLSTFGAVWVVHWNGDYGCSGGNGTSLPHFTVVEHSGFGSAEPVIKADFTIPNLELVKLRSMSARDEILHLEGIAYGPDDRQHQPSQRVSYDLKLEYDQFVLME